MGTMAGDYMAGGPGFNAFSDAAWNAVRPQVDSGFAQGGRYGSSAHQEALGKGFGRAMAPLYNAERDRQVGAMQGAPGLAMADYTDPTMLQAVGAAREQQAQRYADEPTRRLQNYMSLIGGSGYGGTTTTTGGAGSSPLLGAAGGAMSGYGMTGSPWGAAGGAALGYLGSR
jgi:hypothetical protein